MTDPSLLVLIPLVLALNAGLFLVLRAGWIRRYGDASGRRVARDGLRGYLFFFGFCAVVAAVGSTLPPAWAERGIVGLVVLFPLGMAGSYLLRSRTLGDVLLRLPRAAVQWAFLLFAAVSLWMVWAAWASGGSSLRMASSLGVAATAFLLWAFPRELRRGGLSVMGSVLPWERLVEHEWIGPERDTLRLRFRGRLAAGAVLLRIPVGDRERVDRLVSGSVFISGDG